MVYTLGPKQDLNLGGHRMAVFEDCQATILTTQPPRLDSDKKLGKCICKYKGYVGY